MEQTYKIALFTWNFSSRTRMCTHTSWWKLNAEWPCQSNLWDCVESTVPGPNQQLPCDHQSRHQCLAHSVRNLLLSSKPFIVPACFWLFSMGVPNLAGCRNSVTNWVAKWMLSKQCFIVHWVLPFVPVTLSLDFRHGAVEYLLDIALWSKLFVPGGIFPFVLLKRSSILETLPCTWEFS